MKKVGAILFLISFTFIIFSLSCKKELEKEAIFKAIQLVEAEIDTKKIINLTGVQFKILKTETIGYIPLHKFYWVCLKKKVNSQRVEELADSIIKEIIIKKPKTYHSFTIHFFLEDELGASVESSRCFASANFLPQGGWVKVGRVPIDDYKDYSLTYTFLE
jgi:c-di-AMP phosphodiesterase-like protein